MDDDYALDDRDVDAVAAAYVAYGYGDVDPPATFPTATDVDGGGSWIIVASGLTNPSATGE